MGRLKKLKKIRIHREGTHILWASFLLLLLINAALYWGIDCKIPFYVVAVAKSKYGERTLYSSYRNSGRSGSADPTNCGSRGTPHCHLR